MIEFIFVGRTFRFALILCKAQGGVEKAHPVILRESSDRRISLINMEILRFAQNDTLLVSVFQHALKPGPTLFDYI